MCETDSCEIFQEFHYIGILTGKSKFRSQKQLALEPLYLTFQVRVHWLLDLMEGPFKIGNRLDSFVHLLWSNNLRPGFEIMGNPGQFFQSNFTGTLLLKSSKYCLIYFFITSYIIVFVLAL